MTDFYTDSCEEYILGRDALPMWLWEKVEVFKSGDDIRYEFHGSFNDIYGRNGDLVRVKGRKWWVISNE